MSDRLSVPLADQIRAKITEFLDQRLRAKLASKLGNNEDEIRRERLRDSYAWASWMADAARRASQLKQVTHGVKFTHPDARGSNLNSAGNTAVDAQLVTSRDLPRDHAPDVVGNAAALDVYQFLRLTVDQRSLLEFARTKDPTFAAVLSDDPAEAAAWMAAFASIAEPPDQLASHTLAKQLYWPLEGGGYHLLAPLFPTCLAQAVWNTVNEDRFGTEAQAARAACRDGRAHPRGIRAYPDLAIRHFGGSKPQNISQLNSERRGENYLLAALPPHWTRPRARPPLRVATVFGRWLGKRRGLMELVAGLRQCLRETEGDADSERAARARRAEWVEAIISELIQFAAELHALPPGWSAAPACRLCRHERAWLDPRRDSAHPGSADGDGLDWRDQIQERCARWISACLGGEKPNMSEEQARLWRVELDHHLIAFRAHLDDD